MRVWCNCRVKTILYHRQNSADFWNRFMWKFYDKANIMHNQFAMQLKFLEFDMKLKFLQFCKLNTLCYILPYLSIFVKNSQLVCVVELFIYLVKNHRKKSRKSRNYRVCHIGMEKAPYEVWNFVIFRILHAFPIIEVEISIQTPFSTYFMLMRALYVLVSRTAFFYQNAL